jgi:hypothetical protein
VNTLYCLEEWRGEQKISPLGDNFTPGGESLPLGAKLRMGLCLHLLNNPWAPTLLFGLTITLVGL